MPLGGLGRGEEGNRQALGGAFGKPRNGGGTREAVGGVGDLGGKEEEERLAEVPEDPGDTERHSGEESVGVPDEDLRGVPVEGEEAKSGRNEGHHQER